MIKDKIGYLEVGFQRRQHATLPRGERLGDPNIQNVRFGDRRRIGIRFRLDPLQVRLQIYPERMSRLHEIFRRFNLDLVDLSDLGPFRFEDAAFLRRIVTLLRDYRRLDLLCLGVPRPFRLRGGKSGLGESPGLR